MNNLQLAVEHNRGCVEAIKDTIEMVNAIEDSMPTEHSWTSQLFEREVDSKLLRYANSTISKHKEDNGLCAYWSAYIDTLDDCKQLMRESERSGEKWYDYTRTATKKQEEYQIKLERAIQERRKNEAVYSWGIFVHEDVVANALEDDVLNKYGITMEHQGKELAVLTGCSSDLTEYMDIYAVEKYKGMSEQDLLDATKERMATIMLVRPAKENSTSSVEEEENKKPMRRGTNMQKLIVDGNLTKDVEVQRGTGKDGKPWTRGVMSVAVNEGGKKEPLFLQFEVWGTQAENAEKYLQKGSKVFIEGSIENNNYKDNDGAMHYGFKFRADNIQYLANTKGVSNEMQDVIGSPAKKQKTPAKVKQSNNVAENQ